MEQFPKPNNTKVETGVSTSSESQISQTAELKIQEYIDRINGGESKDSIFQGLPNSFKSGIEKGIAEQQREQILSEIPTQYKGMDSETLDMMWTFPTYIDEEKNRVNKEKKARVLEALKEREALNGMNGEPLSAERSDEKRETSVEEEFPILSTEERKNLWGWEASYELAKIAKQSGVDLSKLSREDYVDFAIQNNLKINDDQLRAASWQRMGISAREIISGNREKRAEIKKEVEDAFAKFSFAVQERAAQTNRFISENIRIRQGTKDSNSWLFFGINNGTGERGEETYKSYISFKDLNTLSPGKFLQFMIELRNVHYNGDVKIFQDLLGQGITLNDQIVMHGSSRADAQLALQVAEKFFGDELDQKSLGKDEVINGEEKSYSRILAERISEAVKEK